MVMLRVIIVLLVIIAILLFSVLDYLKRIEKILDNNSYEQTATQKDIFKMEKGILRCFNKEYDKQCEIAFINELKQQGENERNIEAQRKKEASKKI